MQIRLPKRFIIRSKVLSRLKTRRVILTLSKSAILSYADVPRLLTQPPIAQACPAKNTIADDMLVKYPEFAYEEFPYQVQEYFDDGDDYTHTSV